VIFLGHSFAHKLCAHLFEKKLKKLERIYVKKIQSIPTFLTKGLTNFAPTFKKYILRKFEKRLR
jgi:hypothetical protein